MLLVQDQLTCHELALASTTGILDPSVSELTSRD